MAKYRNVFGADDKPLLDLLQESNAAKTKGAPLPTSDAIIVKFAESTGIRLTDKGALEVVGSNVDMGGLDGSEIELGKVVEEVEGLSQLVASSGDLSVARLFARPEKDLDAEKSQLDAELTTKKGGEKVADLNLYSVLTVANPTVERMQDLVGNLSALEAVELTYVAPIPVEAATDIAPPTVLDLPQPYLDAAPTGIDARYAWTLPGGRGENVRVVDVEGAWKTDHEDMPDIWRGQGPLGLRFNLFNLYREEHGTAVLGILGAVQNAYGVTGICPASNLGICSIAHGLLPLALDEAASWLRPGDILLIEVQLAGPTANYLNYLTSGDQDGMVAVEFYQDVFDTIRRITERGIVVVEPAGNGTVDLDGLSLGGRFDRAVRDSGALLVGAGAPGSRDPAGFSNTGSRVDVQGWGMGISTLMGRNDVRVPGAEDDSRQWYTRNFGGTSGASPIVAGAAALIQGVLRGHGREALAPRAMRDLLVATGTPQGTGTPSGNDPRHVGPLPNVRASLDRLGLPPAASGWPSMGGVLLHAPEVGHNADGRMEVFGVGQNRRLWRQHQVAPSSGWSGWFELADGLPDHVDLAGRPAVARNARTRLEVFARATDGSIWHVWQDPGSPSGWARWASLGGGAGTDPAVIANRDGRLEVFVRGVDGTLQHCWQQHVDGWWSGWHSMGGQPTGKPAVGSNADGRLEVFVRRTDGLLQQIAQTSPGGLWGGWGSPVGPIGGDPVAVPARSGSGEAIMQVAAVGTGGDVVATAQLGANLGWSALASLGGSPDRSTLPALRTDPSGRVHAFVRWTDGTVRVATRSGPTWASWRSLGGPVQGSPAAGQNADSRLEVFARGLRGDLVHLWEPWP